MKEEKVFDLLATALQMDSAQLRQMPRNTRLADLGLDSLPFVQFLVAVEDTFGIEIADSDLLFQNFETITELFAMLNKYFRQEIMVKKVLICDCDNVLWHGIAGEEEIFIDSLTDALQAKLVELYEHGVLLCLCSKNEPYRLHRIFTEQEMPLKWEHFLIVKASLEAKSNHILQIAGELGLSPDSFVFIDDSDYEIGLVSSLLPGVSTIKANFSDMRFLSELDTLFDTSTPAMDRTLQYRQQKEREKEKLHFPSVQAYNASLQTVATCDAATSEQAERIAELSMRTNRFNLSCKRYSVEEIAQKLEDDRYTVLALSVKDKLGDMGLVGTAVIQKQDAVIEAFFLSCRVFGRGFEQLLLEHIKSLFPDGLTGVYIASDSNRSFSDFYAKNEVQTR